MPNTTVRAAAEGMPDFNRRRLLNLTGAGLALAATAAGIRKAPAAPPVVPQPVASPAKISPVLRGRIKAHRKAEAYFRSVCGCTDSVKLGREATAEEHQKWEDANDDEYATLWFVCAFAARTPADLAYKGRYLKKFHSWRMGELQNDQVTALLLSMVQAGKPRKETAA